MDISVLALRGRVGCIVKELSGAASLAEEDLDEAAGDGIPLSQSAPTSPASLLAVRVRGARPPKLVVRTVRGRRAMEELVARMAHRRRRELAALADRHVVSRFGHKGRIQVINTVTFLSVFSLHNALLDKRNHRYAINHGSRAANCSVAALFRFLILLKTTLFNTSQEV